MKEYRCPYCGRIMVDYDDSVRFACQYCKKEVTGWEREFSEKLKGALPSDFYNSEQNREDRSIAMDREKVIKAYEDFVNGYECFCTSDDYEYEMHKAVLSLLKEQDEEVRNAYERGMETGRKIKW